MHAFSVARSYNIHPREQNVGVVNLQKTTILLQFLNHLELEDGPWWIFLNMTNNEIVLSGHIWRLPEMQYGGRNTQNTLKSA